MHDVVILLIKAVAGGLLVVCFALVCQALEPKRFAGLFGAAPAVAIAGLAIVLIGQGHGVARQEVKGMLAGGAGMVAYASLVIPLLKRLRAPRAAAIALSGWFLVAAVVALPIMLAWT